jgi:hypothetical protein
VYKVVQTGKYASGGAFMREVNLCPKCAAEAEKQEKAQQKTKTIIMVVIALVLAGAAFWFFLNSSQ